MADRYATSREVPDASTGIPRPPSYDAAPAGFVAGLAAHGTRPALLTADGAVSYAELDDRVAAARGALAALGGRQLVRLRPAPQVDFVVSWLAALSGGHATLLSHDDGLARAYSVSMERSGDWQPTGLTAPQLHPDLRLLLSTSGSTGSPKLVRLSAVNLASNAAAIADYLDLKPEDCALTTLPLDYCYGLSVLHSHLAVGASVLLEDRSVVVPEVWTRARAAGVTSFAGVPHTFDLLANTGWPQLPTLRQVTQAGGRMAAERVRDLALQGEREDWDLVVMYGQTEATARMAWLPPHLAASRPTAVGVPVPGGDLRVQPLADGQLPAGLGDDVGEVVYRGPNVMMGYATTPADLARGAELRELRTGDLGRIADDGLVEIVGRRARFAKLFGQRIDLDRVQTLLALGGHETACAEGAEGGQLVVAVPDADDPILLDEVAAATCDATGLPPHAVRVVPVAALPRLASGKVDHRAVAELVAPQRPSATDPAQAVGALYGRVLGRARVGPDESFASLGGDSLTYVELSLRLERQLGELPSDWPSWTVAQLAERLGRRRRPSAWARLDTTILLRAVGIVLIVGSHTDLWMLLGGAHVLLAVAGANFARFHLADEAPRARLRRVARATARVAVPAVLWIGVVAAVTGDYGWRQVLLLNGLLGSRDWSEPAWYYWFVEVVLLLTVGAGLLTSLPRMMLLERRHPFGLAAGLTVIALCARWWAELASYDGDVIHSSTFVAWLFAGGWAAAAAQTVRQRLLVTALLLGGTWGFTGDPEREALIAGGLLTLVWLRTVPWPRALIGTTGMLASASLHVYLTHWQVYPWFEDRWPLGGLLSSLAVGILVWYLAGRVAGWTARSGRPDPHYAPDQPERQEIP